MQINNYLSNLGFSLSCVRGRQWLRILSLALAFAFGQGLSMEIRANEQVNGSLRAESEKQTYTVRRANSENGSILITGADNLRAVPHGTVLKVEVRPHEGYELATLMANDTDITQTLSFVVTADTRVVATFRQKTYAVRRANSENGSILITGANNLRAVPHGTELKVEVRPHAGYELASLKANETDISQTLSFIVTEDTRVVATFREKQTTTTYRVSTRVEGKGSIGFTGARDLEAVPHGTELRVYAAEGVGHELTALTANGVDIIESKRITVTADTEVVGIFSKKNYAVTLEQTEGGTISISDKDEEALKAIPYETELTVKVKPQNGYELVTLMAGKNDITQSKQFTVKGATTVRATFRKVQTYRVTYRVEGKGSIGFTGARDMEAVAHGTELRVATADGVGHELTSLTSNGVDILKTKRFTVTTDTEVVGIFSKKTYTVTLPKVDHATVRIKGNPDLTKVPYETELELEVLPEKGFVVEEVKINGKAAQAPYKFSVKSNVQIEVRIKQDTAIGMIKSSSIRLYPNPATSYIAIEGAGAGARVRLINLVGRVVLDSRLGENGRLYVQNLERGVYILQVAGEAHRIVLI